MISDRQPWLEMDEEHLEQLMRGADRGVEHPSRIALRALIAPRERLLDVGCNTGVTYEGLKLAGVEVDYTGVDLAPKAIEVARRMFPEAQFQQADLLQGLPFADNSFDTVICRHLLEHLPVLEEPLAELLRVARRRLLLVFFLPPQDFPGRDRVDLNIGGGVAYHHIWSSSLVRRCLAGTQISLQEGLGSCHLGPFKNCLYEVILPSDDSLARP